MKYEGEKVSHGNSFFQAQGIAQTQLSAYRTASGRTGQVPGGLSFMLGETARVSRGK